MNNNNYKRATIHHSEYTCYCKYISVIPVLIKNVINYSPSCGSKPVRPSFIFGTQLFDETGQGRLQAWAGVR